MRIVDVRERAVDISRYDDAAIPSGGLNTSIVAIVTDAVVDGARVTGYGFSSIGRFAQSGLIRERFAPRLLAAPASTLGDDDGSNIDPFAAWTVMLQGEKPGGHGERCVAVGALDMALWDAAAKIARLPLYRFVRSQLGRGSLHDETVRVYGGGGYRYPADDGRRLASEMRRMLDLGFTHAKIKIGGGVPIAEDLKRVEIAAAALGSPERLAVDAMNSYDAIGSIKAADALSPYGLWWFEDMCDPLDFDTHAAVARRYPHPIAAGEALFSVAEARLLDRFGGLRRDRDILLFDPAHCYGLPGYLRIVDLLESAGWPRSAFWPHGGHLYTLHVACALELGGSELNPFSFQPFGGQAGGIAVENGRTRLPDVAGIGFETKSALAALFAQLAA